MSVAVRQAVAPPGASARPMPGFAPVTALLEQLRDVVTLLPPSLYLARPAARVSGSVGEHVRHCLDHVSALVGAIGGEPLSYDRRRRGTTVEIDPVTAVSEIERLLYQLDRLTVTDRHVTLSAVVDAGLPALTMQSTIAREIAFVQLHAVHHCAIIAVLLEWQGCRVPDGFGLAPSTARARHAGRQ